MRCLLPFFAAASRGRLVCLLASLMVAGHAVGAGPTAAEQQGQALVADLRQLRPIEGNGILRLRSPEGKWVAALPVKVGFEEGSQSWQARYQSFPTNGSPAETLTVIHPQGQPNLYLYARNGAAADRLSGGDAAVPFAGSEFWLTDLGLEFLEWPEQRVLKHEMRKGRSCRVLESVNPHPAKGDYARVLSWVDIEHKGILRAEAYDGNRKLVKEFSIGSFKKIKDADGQGRWHLKSMEIRNEKTDARTRLEFDYTAPG